METTGIGRKPRNIRSGNRQLILRQYKEVACLSISEIAARVKLSRTTVMKINDSLLREGIIRDAGKGASTGEGGKKPSVFKLNESRLYILTWHIQYSRIRFRLFNLALRTCYARTAPIERDAAFETILLTLKEFYKEAQEEIPSLKENLLAAMVAVHGTVDAEKGICRHSTYFPSWGVNLPIADEVARSLEIDAPVYADNWIRFKAYAETEGTGPGEGTNLVLIDAGWHGLTAGILIKGRPYRGRHFISGEIGHMVLDLQDTEVCGCGARGCFESLILCARLIRDAQALRSRYPASAIFQDEAPSDEELLYQIFKASREGDELACLLLEKRSRVFAQALANLCVVVDPDVIILEGDYASAGEFFRARLVDYFQSITLPRMTKEVSIQFRNTPSMTPKTLEGAAAYALEHYFSGTPLSPGSSPSLEREQNSVIP